MDQYYPPVNNCTLVVELDYIPVMFFNSLVTPTLEINGYKEKRNWGKHVLYVPPGRYVVAASYPWLFNAESGKNYVDIVLHPGETRHVIYSVPFLRYFPGKMRVY